MSLNKVLDYLGENRNVKTRRSGDEITIFLGEDVVKIHLEDKTAEFPDMDLVNERTLRERYYAKFPQLRSLFLKLVEEEYEIQPQ